MSEQITGTVERIVFANEENGFVIAEVTGEESAEPITVTGRMPGIQPGEAVAIEGRWVDHERFGRQFEAASWRATLPSGINGIRKFLGSGLVSGIGKGLAERIVDRFGKDTLAVIEHESARLREVSGIGKQRARSIKAAWDEQREIRETMIFLQEYGVTTGLALRLYREYGDRTTTLLQEDPYRVAREVRGIGFKTADRIALNLGLDRHGPARIEAGLLHVLDERASEGHTATPREILTEVAAETLDAPAEFVDNGITSLLRRGDIVAEKEGPLQTQALARAEDQVARAVRRLIQAPSAMPPIRIPDAVAWAQEQAGFHFAPEQETALETALRSNLSILTGGPGTGKTTILRALVAIVRAKNGKILLASPTGRAAQRLAQATDHAATTIHRMLAWEPAAGGFAHDSDNPLECHLLVVDEASMLDTPLAASLLTAVPAGAHLVLVGDIDQLPSVGPGNVLRDLIESACLPVNRLRAIFRQEAGSEIVATAHDILEGRQHPPRLARTPADLDPKIQLHFIETESPERSVDAIVRLVRDWIPRHLRADPMSDVQVLCPMHRGEAGTQRLNERLREALNPQEIGLTVGLNRFHPGDKVIQTRNRHELGVFNGELGLVADLPTDGEGLSVRFDDRTVDYARLDLVDLSPAFAITVHKAQGSEFPVVVMPLLRQHFVMLRRNLLYTAITRGKRAVFLVGDPSAYRIAVRAAEEAHRETCLRERLNAG